MEKPESCARCPLRDAPGPVRNFGPPDARIMIIGEAPGAEEVDYPHFRPKFFRPFIGGSGRLLTALCCQAGIDRYAEANISNVVKCRPPGNRTPTDFERACCRHFLIEEINAVKPNVIIALGDVALTALTGESGIGNWRGVPICGAGEFNKYKIFPTWHPAFIARMQFNWPFAVHDLVRAKAESAFPEVCRRGFAILRNSPKASEVAADATRSGVLAFDLETTGLDPRRSSVLYLGVAARPDAVHVLKWGESVQALLQRIFDNPSVEIIGQNILYFDYPFLIEKGVTVPWGRTFDTLVAFHLANSSYGQTPVKGQESGKAARGMEKDLTMIASCHTDMPYWKSRQNYAKDLSEVCGRDVIATIRSAEGPTGLKRELECLGMIDLYYKHVLPVHPILHEMHTLGVKVDEGCAAAWSLALENHANRAEAEIRQTFGKPFLNLESPKQLSELLYDELKLPVQYTYTVRADDPRRPTVNVDALDNLSRLAPENEVLRRILEVRKCRKMKSTFVDPAIRAGRHRPYFGTSKTSTGRMNSWNPNAQNVPEDMRDFWVADDDDCVLLVSDWSQIEWRLAVVLSGDETGLKLLATGVDTHRAIASEILQKPYDAVSSMERNSAKFIVYGVGYGRSAKSLADSPLSRTGGAGRGQIVLPIEFVQNFLDRFMTRFADFRRWREDNVKFVERNNYLVNAFKRRRWWYTSAVTEVFNYPQQSTAADMMYRVLIDLHRELPKGSTLRLTVHDEVVINTPKSAIRETWRVVKDVMEQPWQNITDFSARPDVVRRFHPNGWFCPADISIGRNWKQAKSKEPTDKAARKELMTELALTDLG